MSEDERKNDHNKNKKQMKSAQEEECKPLLQELLAQMDANANVMSPEKPKTPTFPLKGESASRSTNLLSLLPLEQGKTGTGLFVSGSISGKNPLSVDVHKQKSSTVAQASKKIATGRNKGMVIKEEQVLKKRARPSSYNVQQLPKGSICDSELDATTEDDTDEFDSDYNLDLTTDDDADESDRDNKQKGKRHSDK